MKKERNIYLENTDLEVALKGYLERFEEELENKPVETISVVDSLGRVTARPYFAKYSSPNFNASAMDGIAVKSENTFGAREGKPLTLVKGRDYKVVDTGDPIDGEYNAVIMIEDLNELSEEEVQIMTPASPWQHVRPVGEDIVAGEMIVSANHKIRPVDLASLINGGIDEIQVYARTKVGIIPTGTEIVEPGTILKRGDIIESNSRMFEGLTLECGAIPSRYQVVRDDYEEIKKTVMDSVEKNDITIINAGSSAGTEDYTKSIVEELGEVCYHGLSIKPGKPAILGKVKGKPVIGIPGYPVSAYMVFRNIAREIIMEFMSLHREKPAVIQAYLSKRIVSSYKYKEFVRVKLGKLGGKIIATPLNRGAGVLMSLVRCDGILVIPKEKEGFEASELVQIELLKDYSKIENTVVSIGSHDLVMDIVNNHIHMMDSMVDLSSAHTGSMGGIMALRKGECHLAPIHLLDEKTGIYNVPVLQKYLRGTDVVLVKGFGRTQGFMVQKGNPRNIKSLRDLSRDDVSFVNRQKGSGTRVLLDYRLKQEGMDRNDITGYEREMTTHMAVAAAVSSGTADVGLGVYSAAKTMNLDFIPLAEEEYDFAMLKEEMNNPKIKTFLKVIKSRKLKEELKELGGYTFENTGKVVKI
ncbi:molybdopterin molybdochelatase [Dethiosulfatibacter aminovorans DSM 17477]|uniref:Molybdopterin molybdenumtransferase n=1 Tax=Dethiosulfatibacter aminovorans DSM 17477 TaxID=1121476 RepID=A0A1M6LI57_9FIRM|nr:molybdopterin biosynthesis protein [Dethiosulfatibacter aminovorans]SHJ70795.1 molybdopterin molybdochelatase [Dethiosulfatibacter aminovorans DSM 17477]